MRKGAGHLVAEAYNSGAPTPAIAKLAQRQAIAQDPRVIVAQANYKLRTVPDSADALRVLKRHYQLVILSNVHRDGFAASNRKLGVAFDAIYTAQDIGSYKPAPANFEYLLAHLKSDLGLEPGDVLHTAQSLHHDHVPAKAVGLANVWIDRRRLSEGGDWGATAHVTERPEIDRTFFTLAEMAEAVEREAA